MARLVVRLAGPYVQRSPPQPYMQAVGVSVPIFIGWFEAGTFWADFLRKSLGPLSGAPPKAKSWTPIRKLGPLEAPVSTRHPKAPTEDRNTGRCTAVDAGQLGVYAPRAMDSRLFLVRRLHLVLPCLSSGAARRQSVQTGPERHCCPAHCTASVMRLDRGKRGWVPSCQHVVSAVP